MVDVTLRARRGGTLGGTKCSTICVGVIKGLEGLYKRTKIYTAYIRQMLVQVQDVNGRIGLTICQAYISLYRIFHQYILYSKVSMPYRLLPFGILCKFCRA